MANLTRRESRINTSKGQTSAQVYGGSTTKRVSRTDPGYTDTRQGGGTNTGTVTRTSGDVRETRTTTGVSKTSQTQEDYGVVLRFKIPFQGKQPILRS